MKICFVNCLVALKTRGHATELRVEKVDECKKSAKTENTYVSGPSLQRDEARFWALMLVPGRKSVKKIVRSRILSEHRLGSSGATYQYLSTLWYVVLSLRETEDPRPQITI